MPTIVVGKTIVICEITPTTYHISQELDRKVVGYVPITIDLKLEQLRQGRTDRKIRRESISDADLKC
jgi:hypothetical protein